MGLGQWLKVAADRKADLMKSAMATTFAHTSEVCAELGTFVGYTATRLAAWVATSGSSPGRSVSMEVDPIHALLTRHFLNLVGLFHHVDVWIGQALDTIPRLSEEFGSKSCVLAFMDHRGTKFHSDMIRLQHREIPSHVFVHICDNTLKPGAPVLLWRASNRQRRHQEISTNWSLNEFAHWNSEDWMLVSLEMSGKL